MSSAVRVCSPSVPPLKSRTLNSLAKLSSALAAAAGSPLMKVSAVGPSLTKPLISSAVATPALVGGPDRQRVLDDPEAGVGLAQAGAQRCRLRDAQAPVVDGVDRIGGVDLLRDLVDQLCLLLFLHVCPTKKPAHGRAGERRSLSYLFRLDRSSALGCRPSRASVLRLVMVLDLAAAAGRRHLGRMLLGLLLRPSAP